MIRPKANYTVGSKSLTIAEWKVENRTKSAIQNPDGKGTQARRDPQPHHGQDLRQTPAPRLE